MDSGPPWNAGISMTPLLVLITMGCICNPNLHEVSFQVCFERYHKDSEFSPSQLLALLFLRSASWGTTDDFQSLLEHPQRPHCWNRPPFSSRLQVARSPLPSMKLLPPENPRGYERERAQPVFPRLCQSVVGKYRSKMLSDIRNCQAAAIHESRRANERDRMMRRLSPVYRSVTKTPWFDTPSHPRGCQKSCSAK